MATQRTIIMTAGDPWSVTTECWVRLFLAPGAPYPAQVRERLGVRVILCGSAELIDRQIARLGHRIPSDFEVMDNGIPVGCDGLYPMDPIARGAHAIAALEQSVRMMERMKPRNCALVTGPIDKKSCALAGFGFSGHTEFFESRWGAPVGGEPAQALMILAGPRLRVGLVTRHLALRDVPGALTSAVISQSLVTLVAALREHFGIQRPRIAVCGLNPHAGDNGLFGDEESRVISPGIAIAGDEARLVGATVAGPLSADTVFHAAWAGDYDAVLAMYHDQGLAPLKALHFHESVNLSAGLRYLRVSPDHGPAASLFMAGSSNPGSFQASVAIAFHHLGISA